MKPSVSAAVWVLCFIWLLLSVTYLPPLLHDPRPPAPRRGEEGGGRGELVEGEGRGCREEVGVCYFELTKTGHFW